MKWMQVRLPPIEGLAASGRVRPEVLEKVLAPIQAKLSELGRSDLLAKANEEDRADAKELAARVKRLLEKAKTGK
jgi:hypothetical protein